MNTTAVAKSVVYYYHVVQFKSATYVGPAGRGNSRFKVTTHQVFEKTVDPLLYDTNTTTAVTAVVVVPR